MSSRAGGSKNFAKSKFWKNVSKSLILDRFLEAKVTKNRSIIVIENIFYQLFQLFYLDSQQPVKMVAHLLRQLHLHQSMHIRQRIASEHQKQPRRGNCLSQILPKSRHKFATFFGILQQPERAFRRSKCFEICVKI